MGPGATMQAAFYQGARTFTTGTLPVPRPEPDEALLRVHRVGICGQICISCRGIRSPSSEGTSFTRSVGKNTAKVAEKMMKTVFTMLATVAAVAIVFQPAVAGLSMSANFNPGEASRILILANPRGGIGTGILKMKFTSAAGGAFLNFCVGRQTTHAERLRPLW